MPESISFIVTPPPEILRRDVECIRTAIHTGTSRGLEVKVCPSGLPGIVFQVAGDGSSAIESISTRTARAENIPLLFLHGQGAEPSIMSFKKGPYVTMQVVLKPHALYTLFGRDTSSLRGGVLLPEDFGADALTMDLLEATSESERITLLYRFLIEFHKKLKKRDELVESSLDIIHKNIGSVSAKTLIEQLHISERQFQKRFARVVGVPPQLYIRIKRVNEALRLIGSGRYERLSDVAFTLNFYDQPHFIREIKTFSWVTPTSITQKVSEFHNDIAGSSYL